MFAISRVLDAKSGWRLTVRYKPHLESWLLQSWERFEGLELVLVQFGFKDGVKARRSRSLGFKVKFGV